MPSPTALINKLNGVLKRYAPTERLAYLRTVTQTGGDPLTHKKGTVTYVDVLLSPQPIMNRIGREHIPGGHAKWEVVEDSSNQLVLADDWEMLVSPSAVSFSTLYNPDTFLVLKDTLNNEEVMRVTDVETVGLQGTDVVFTVYVRSIKHP